jgi:hypothetical protein
MSFSEKVTEQLGMAKAIAGNIASTMDKQNTLGFTIPPYLVMTTFLTAWA